MNRTGFNTVHVNEGVRAVFCIVTRAITSSIAANGGTLPLHVVTYFLYLAIVEPVDYWKKECIVDVSVYGFSHELQVDQTGEKNRYSQMCSH